MKDKVNIHLSLKLEKLSIHSYMYFSIFAKLIFFYINIKPPIKLKKKYLILLNKSLYTVYVI